MNSQSLLLPPWYLLSKPPSLKSSTASHKQCHKLQGTKFSNVWAQRGHFLFKLSHKICGRFRYFQGDESSFGGSSKETQLLVYDWLKIFLFVGMSSSLAKSMWGRNRSMLIKLEHLNKPWCSMQPEPPLILLQEDEQRVWLFQSVRNQLLSNYKKGRRLVVTPVTVPRWVKGLQTQRVILSPALTAAALKHVSRSAGQSPVCAFCCQEKVEDFLFINRWTGVNHRWRKRRQCAIQSSLKQIIYYPLVIVLTEMLGRPCSQLGQPSSWKETEHWMIHHTDKHQREELLDVIFLTEHSLRKELKAQLAC